MTETLTLAGTILALLGVIGVGIAWGAQRTKVNASWDLHSELLVAIHKIGVLWALMVEPAIARGLLERGSDVQITAKGREVLDRARNRMEIRCQELLAEGLSTHAILSDIHPQIMLLAEELGEEPGAVFGLVEVHINEKRSA